MSNTVNMQFPCSPAHDPDRADSAKSSTVQLARHTMSSGSSTVTRNLPRCVLHRFPGDVSRLHVTMYEQDGVEYLQGSSGDKKYGMSFLEVCEDIHGEGITLHLQRRETLGECRLTASNGQLSAPFHVRQDQEYFFCLL